MSVIDPSYFYSSDATIISTSSTTWVGKEGEYSVVYQPDCISKVDYDKLKEENEKLCSVIYKMMNEIIIIGNVKISSSLRYDIMRLLKEIDDSRETEEEDSFISKDEILI